MINTCFACGTEINFGTKCPKCGYDTEYICPMLKDNKCISTKKICKRLNQDYYGCEELIKCQL